MEYNVEIEFLKNRHYPDFGPDAYSIECHRVKLSYGKHGMFKSSNKAIDYAKSKLTDEVLAKFDGVLLMVVKGGSGEGVYLKHSTVKSDEAPIDKEYANSLFSEYLK